MPTSEYHVNVFRTVLKRVYPQARTIWPSRARLVARDKTFNNYARMTSTREVMRCQNEIAKIDPHPGESSTYRNAELYFWLRIPQWIYEDFANYKIERCLDIGCGPGTLALYCHKLTGCDTYCVDCDVRLCKSLIKKYNFHYDISNIEIDPFPYSVKFDIIILTEVLEHLNFHPVPTLKKICNLLSEQGKLYLSTPDGGWFQWGRITEYYSTINDMPLPKKGLQPTNTICDHVYQYTKRELLDILDEAGLRVQRFDYSPGHMGYRHFNLVLAKKENAHKT